MQASRRQHNNPLEHNMQRVDNKHNEYKSNRCVVITSRYNVHRCDFEHSGDRVPLTENGFIDSCI